MKILLDKAMHRMSVQHAHPLGPWKAMVESVRAHHANWKEAALARSLENAAPKSIYRVLDLACGPRGEPGTTLARALPLANVHCTDFCPIAVADIPIYASEDDIRDSRIDDRKSSPPPKNLTKSVIDLTDLSSYPSQTFHAMLCCYGYALASDLSRALSEAHRVLRPGGVLVISTWESSAMSDIGRDVLAYVRTGGRDPYGIEDGNDEAFLPPRLPPVETAALSRPGELEGLLFLAGFEGPGAVVTTRGVYPFDLGNEAEDQYAMGTMLVWDELESLGIAMGCEEEDGDRCYYGGWRNLAEEAFWVNIHKYTDKGEGGLMLLRDNVFKMTVSKKSLL